MKGHLDTPNLTKKRSSAAYLIIILLMNHINSFGVTGMCSIAYEPCDENSFKIGPPIFSGELRGGQYIIR